MVILEDVALQLGLKVDGKAVTRPTLFDCEELCYGLHQHCRTYILGWIGGVIMLDKSGNILHLMYLPLLADLECQDDIVGVLLV
uniref:Uncharacterized protein n=1 Tax=Cajanus cajan TaxID=3821 RepID=A0A151TE13_CAJCA|nr:hypothetical protein KK1_011514 [Cajanus cajan]